MNKSMAKDNRNVLGFVLRTVLGVGAYAYTIYQQSTQDEAAHENEGYTNRTSNHGMTTG